MRFYNLSEKNRMFCIEKFWTPHEIHPFHFKWKLRYLKQTPELAPLFVVLLLRTVTISAVRPMSWKRRKLLISFG